MGSTHPRALASAGDPQLHDGFDLWARPMFCGISRSFVRGGACIVERTHEPREASRTSHAPHAVVMWAGVRGRAARARPCDSASVGK